MKRLSLKTEHLSALTTDELAAVQGGIPTILGICDWTQQSSPINCVTEFTACFCK